MLRAVFLPLSIGPKEAQPVTHSEMTHWLPGPEGIGYSSCDGRMVESELTRSMRHKIDGHRPPGTRSELWHCEKCHFTLHLEVDSRGVRRIRNGYPEPSIPSLKIV